MQRGRQGIEVLTTMLALSCDGPWSYWEPFKEA